MRTTFHYPESPYGRTYADVITKISRMDSLPNYLSYGAPLAQEAPLQSTFHVVLCLLYTYWDIHHFGGLFILNLSKMLKFAATHLPQNDNENEVSAF